VIMPTASDWSHRLSRRKKLKPNSGRHNDPFYIMPLAPPPEDPLRLRPVRSTGFVGVGRAGVEHQPRSQVLSVSPSGPLPTPSPPPRFGNEHPTDQRRMMWNTPKGSR
jgi:hypothetical protein